MILLVKQLLTRSEKQMSLSTETFTRVCFAPENYCFNNFLPFFYLTQSLVTSSSQLQIILIKVSEAPVEMPIQVILFKTEDAKAWISDESGKTYSSSLTTTANLNPLNQEHHHHQQKIPEKRYVFLGF